MKEKSLCMRMGQDRVTFVSEIVTSMQPSYREGVGEEI